MIATVAWGLLAVAAAAAVDFRLTVLHTNDMHSQYEETCRGAVTADGSCDDAGGYGGFPRLRRALDAERARAAADGAPAVYLYAGDTFQGTPFHDVLRWEPAADFVGDLGVDVMVCTHTALHLYKRVPDVVCF